MLPAMNKDWFPFFSMAFWFCTKLIGLSFLNVGLTALNALLADNFEFRQLLFTALLPIAIGGFLLVTDVVFDIGTAEQRRRLGQGTKN
jgi:hypothetical protein